MTPAAAKAAPCPVGGSVTLTAGCEINGSASYTDLTIPNGVVVTSSVGQKIDITVSNTFRIDAGGGIDVSGKGDNTAGVGVIGVNLGGIACVGVYGGGGGGGGYGGAGGAGGNDCCGGNGGAGGSTYGSNTNPVDLGSKGGLGAANASGAGMGGGAVKITARDIVLNGYTRANGTNGSDPSGTDGTGGEGGGSGGSV